MNKVARATYVHTCLPCIVEFEDLRVVEWNMELYFRMLCLTYQRQWPSFLAVTTYIEGLGNEK